MASLTHNFIRGLAAVHLAAATNIAYIANCNLFFQAEGLVIEAVESEPQIVHSLENILTRFCPYVVFDNLFLNSAYLNPLLHFATDVLPFTTLQESCLLRGIPARVIMVFTFLFRNLSIPTLFPLFAMILSGQTF